LKVGEFAGDLKIRDEDCIDPGNETKDEKQQPDDDDADHGVTTCERTDVYSFGDFSGHSG
jgi:hypothetical protein